MELFTLGADRGAYTETDVRELARALTGWRARLERRAGLARTSASTPPAPTPRAKTLWAGTPHERSGDVRLARRVHAVPRAPVPPLVLRAQAVELLRPAAPERETQAALEALYVNSGYPIRPVVEAILLHPDLYDGAPLVKPPAVYSAGLLRARGRTITHDAWAWRCAAGRPAALLPAERLGLERPGVARHLDHCAALVHRLRGPAPGERRPRRLRYGSTETPEEALDAPLAFWGHPTLTAETLRRAAGASPPRRSRGARTSWEQGRLPRLPPERPAPPHRHLPRLPAP